MSGQHTPGPWAAESQCSGSGWVDIIAPSADRLPVGYATPADCGEPHERRDDETKANARLMAAAPKLLAKVEQYASECAACDGRGYVVTYTDPYERGDVSSPERSPCPDCADIRAVIAEATGAHA